MSATDIKGSFWSALVLQHRELKLYPLTFNNLDLFMAWMKDEVNDADPPVRRPSWNPLDSTLKLPGSKDFNLNNGFPVQSYVNRTQGLLATARTLLDPRHAGILASLRADDSPYYTAIEIGYDGSWGSDPLVICEVLHDMGVGMSHE